MTSEAGPLVAIDADAGLWAADKRSRQGFHWRMAVVELDGGGVAVVSPIRGMREDLHQELDARGGVRALLAPNHFHYLGLAEYCERYPAADVACSAQARARLSRKTAVSYADMSVIESALPGHVQVLSPPSLRTGEVWLRVETSRGIAWVVSDAFFNMPAHPTGTTGLLCRLTLTTGGLRIGRTFTALAVREARRYRAWLLAQIERDEPRILVPGHGEILESSELPSRLATLVTDRLR